MCCNTKSHGPFHLSFGRQHMAERCWLKKGETDKTENEGMYR